MNKIAFVSALLALVTVPGCFNPLAGLDGDHTRGELGRTDWQMIDGLCPGLGGGCALDVPVAAGARVMFAVDGIDGLPVDLSATGAVVADGSPVVSEDATSDTFVNVRTTMAGVGRVELLDGTNVVDRVSLNVRVATRLDCNAWEIGAPLGWRMEGLSGTPALTLPAVAPEDAPYLACRASDAAGPLLTRDAIQWTIVSGSEVIDIRSDGLDLLDDGRAEGARIRYERLAAGTAVVRATLGDVSQDITITLE